METQMLYPQISEPRGVAEGPTLAEMQAAMQELAETQAAIRKCLSDLIGSSALTWR